MSNSKATERTSLLQKMDQKNKEADRGNEHGSSHNALGLFIVILTTVVFVVVVTFNYISSFGGAGIFLNNTGQISDFYYVEVTPAGWTFGVIWATIYTWNSIAIVYCLTTLCRRGSRDAFLYIEPTLTPPTFYISLIFNLIFNITWIFMWDRQIIEYSVIISALMTFFLYTAIFFSARATVVHESEFIKMTKEVWLVRFLVHNAVGFYATWVTIATLLNLAIALTYRAGLDQSVACTILLSVLTAEIVAWFVIDLFIFNKYVRYIFSPYIVLCLAFTGSIAKNWNPAKTNSIFSAVLLGVVGVLSIVKVISIFWRPEKKNKITQTQA